MLTEEPGYGKYRVYAEYLSDSDVTLGLLLDDTDAQMCI